MCVAALQMRSGAQPGPNLAELDRLAGEAAAQGATYALSPEVTVVFAENREGAGFRLANARSFSLSVNDTGAS